MFKKVILVASLSLCIINSAHSEQCVVEYIPDGDTITCSGKDIRFAHIDTPECGQQPYGQLAKDHLAGIIPVGTVVEATFDKKGRYGRYISVIYVDGLNVNLQMVEDGYAFHYKKYSSDVSYDIAEANGFGKGITHLMTQKPWDYRHTVPYEVRRKFHCK